MSNKIFNSTTFRKIFLSYTAIMIIPVIIFSATNMQKNIENQQIQIYNKHSEDAVRISGNVDNKLMELKNMGERVRNETWVNKMMVDSDIYKDEFDVLKNKEIINDLKNYISESGILSIGVIVYPEKDIVVSPDGIYNTDYFFSSGTHFDNDIYKTLSDSVNEYNIFKVMQLCKMTLWGNKKKVIPVLQSLELVDRPRAVLLLFIDSFYLESFVRRVEGIEMVSIIINDKDEQILEDVNFKTGNEDGKIKNNKFLIDSKVCNWRYTLFYNKGTAQIGIKNIYSLLLVATISLIVGTIAAYLLAKISYKPIYALLNKISSNIKGEQIKNHKGHYSEFSLIEKSFNQLVKENSTLQKVADDYKSAARCNALLMLLKGYFKDDQLDESLMEFGLNYTDDMYFCTILINFDYIYDSSNIDLNKKIEIITLMSVETVMKQYNLGYQLFEIASADKTIIISSNSIFGEGDMLFNVSSKIRHEIQNNCGIKPDVLYGDVEKGLLGISKSYYLANENLQYLRFSRSGRTNNQYDMNTDIYYFPTDWEIQLINNLKVGNLDTLMRILDELKSENNRRDLPGSSMKKVISMIMETMMRVLKELNIDEGIYAKQFGSKVDTASIEKLWSYIYEVGSLICERTKYSNTTSAMELGNKLLLYVNNNYNNPSMSLKELATVFDMSPSSISKTFKEITGINFVDYICRLRMERAKELLREKEYDVNSIANMVGYENVYSFRRAFSRQEGVKPDEYPPSVDAALNFNCKRSL